jgi:hypothetical protein
MDMKLPAGALVKVEIEVRVPVPATPGEIEDWLRYCYRDNGSLSQANPLINFEPEPFGNFAFDVEFDDRIGVREEFDSVALPNGGRQYKVRYSKLPFPSPPTGEPG